MISDAPVSRRATRRAPLIVAKFGGTSVASAERWQRIEAIAQSHLAEGRRVLLVCSALSGVTDRLESILRTLDAGENPAPMLTELRQVHAALASALGIDGERLLADDFESLSRCVEGVSGPVPARDRALVLAHGELLSTRLGCAWLTSRGHSCARLDARDLLRSLPAAADRDEYYLSASCDTESRPDARARVDATGASIVVTQGFIARGSNDETVLLGRGGSDASASYLAAALDADAVEIWTDVPGMFTADPRLAPDARLLKRLSYAEAEALGSLGAKVLHPRSIEPAWRRGIPLRLGWTERPDIVGTRVTGARPPRGIKAVVGRRELALVIMTRPSSWQPVGFLADVALCFQRRGISMDLVASSPSEIRATIDLSAFPSARSELSLLLEDLSRVCRPRAVPRVGCVSVVGAGANVLSCSKLSSAFAHAHVHLVGHAANGSNVSFVVDEGEVAPLVAKAHAALLTRAEHSSVLGPRWDALLASAVPVAPAAKAAPTAVAGAMIASAKASVAEAGEETAA